MKQNDDSVKDMLVDYLDGSLSERERILLEKELMTNSELKEELDQLKSMLNIIKRGEDEEVPENLKEGFYNMLEEEVEKHHRTHTIQRKRRSLIYNSLKIAAVVSLLLVSYYYGKHQQAMSVEEEFSSLKNESIKNKQLAMLSFMENESASTRIKGVGYIDELSEPGEEIIDALIERMKYDENTNVRLAAVEALENFTSSEKVKQELILGLSTEKDPILQIAIIRILVVIQEKSAIVPFQKLLKSKDTAPFVKQQIKALLPKIL